MNVVMRVVILGLREAESSTPMLGRWTEPFRIARHSILNSREMGEARVRRVLREALEEGYVERRRSHSIGHVFRLTEKAATIR